ncbi:MAG TPA: hypothetical protein VJ698_09085 [Noviherbaspirillum sp.]|uniref:hypothetical protein n=1 Tax=Noviherbaspirillum sp. TaxID=1926288 RepID=UPI002B4A8D5F|nr:hypothetical protein [Noviherbaspirillum sp.]HJV85619.1 hypothetical protein [Noviherbaspirillum sp.]
MFKEYEAAETETKRSKAGRAAAQNDYLKGKSDPSRVKDLKERMDSAMEREKITIGTERKAKREWSKERD